MYIWMYLPYASRRRTQKKKKSKKDLTSMEMETKTERKRRRLMEEESEDDSGGLFIPPEIINMILTRLPADSSLRCRDICKQWRSLIDHPSFIDTHTRQLISSSSTSNSERFGKYFFPNSPASSSGCFLYALQENSKFRLQFVEYYDNDNVYDDVDEKLVVPEFKPSKPITDHPFPFHNHCGYSLYNKCDSFMISSCNGLVLMAKTKPNCLNDIFVSNLFTREYVNLSLGKTITYDKRVRRVQSKGGMAYGFGYLHSTNEYKVVSIYFHDSKAMGEVSVYTLGSGSGSGRWRNKGEIPYRVYNPGGFFANGAIHWFTNTKRREIVSFDLADEEFRVVIPSPPQAASADRVDELGVLGGCLCVTRSDKKKCEIPKDIWVLKVDPRKNSKKKFLWNKRFSIPWKTVTSGVKPYVILKSGKILLHGGTGLISYDPKTKAFNEDRQSMTCDPWVKVIPYTKSFVSLKALGEKDAKCWVQPKALPHVKRQKTGQLRARQFTSLAQRLGYRR